MLNKNYLFECFTYDPRSFSHLVWKVRPREHFNSDHGHLLFNKIFANRQAGSITNTGYANVSVNGKTTAVQRIIYVMFNGELEDFYQVDHIDGNPLNNCPENLRKATRVQNQHNRRTAKGYTKKGNRYHAQITVNKKTKYLGCYCNELEARDAYLEAKRLFHDLKFIPERSL